MGTYDDHLDKVTAVLDRLRLIELCVDAKKSHFVLHDIEYRRYVLSCDAIKPQPEKVTAILALRELQNIKELHRFLGMVQYYHDMWKVGPTSLHPLLI